MNHLEVLVVTPVLDDNEGGVQVHVRETTARLARRGIDVEVLAADPTRAGDAAAGIEGVMVRRARSWPRGADYGFAPAVPRIVWSSAADIVHVQGVHTFVAPMAMGAAALRGIPYVVTLHSGGHSEGWRNRIRSLQWKVIGPLLRRARLIIAVSDFERRQFAAALRMRPEQIKVIPNGSSVPAVPARPRRDGPIHVVTVGRLERYKGHHHVITAWRDIERRWPGSTLSVIGRGPYEPELRSLAAEIAPDSIRFDHFPPSEREGYLQALRTADVLVLLSDYESQGIVVLEALSSGLGVVVHDATALAEYVRLGWASGVEDVRSASELVAAIDEALQPRLTPVCVPTWDDCSSALIQAYHAVIEARQPDKPRGFARRTPSK